LIKHTRFEQAVIFIVCIKQINKREKLNGVLETLVKDAKKRNYIIIIVLKIV